MSAVQTLAASTCYEVRNAVTGDRTNQIFRLRTRASGELVPANEGSSGAPAQTLVDVDGRAVFRTGLPLGRPQVTMHLMTGIVLVAPGKGAQMSLARNFARGFGLNPDNEGLHMLDCGSPTASATPPSWTCQILAATIDAGLTGAPALRLVKIANPALVPDCRTFALSAG